MGFGECEKGNLYSLLGGDGNIDVKANSLIVIGVEKRQQKLVLCLTHIGNGTKFSCIIPYKNVYPGNM